MTGSCAVVIGASGGLGQALALALEERGEYGRVVRLGRGSVPALDLVSEDSIAAAAEWVAGLGEVRLVLDATGFLHDARFRPERALREIDPAHMAHAFAVNAIGPALLMKHFCPLLPREGRAVFATLSARVGSIGDNRVGGLVFLSGFEGGLEPVGSDGLDRAAAAEPGGDLRGAASGDGGDRVVGAVCEGGAGCAGAGCGGGGDSGGDFGAYGGEEWGVF